MGLIRRIVVFTVVVPLTLAGIPLPAHAGSSEETVPLTFNGRPLFEVLQGRAADASFPLPALRQQADGQISGVVVDEEDGQPVADQRVELRRPVSAGSGRLVAITDTKGQFVYGRLGFGRYEVELRVEGRVIATSGPIELSEEVMRVSGVNMARPAPSVPRQRRPRLASADQLLKGKPVMASFNEVQSILDPGHEVIVRDDGGRATRGRVVSISEAQLVIERRRFFRRTEELALAEGSVQRIEIVDSIADGLLLGFAVALVGCPARAFAAACSPFAGGLFLFLGGLVGGSIDASINGSIYERPSQTLRVTIAPSFGRGVIGVSAHVTF